MTKHSHPPTCGQAGNLGTLRLSKSTRKKDGSCNLCTNTTHTIIHILQANRTQIRICPTCLQQITEYGTTNWSKSTLQQGIEPK